MKFEIMDQTGHSTVEFDKTTWAGVDRAMRLFAKLVGEDKMTPATRPAGGDDYKVVKDFKDLQEESLFVRPMKGG